MKLEDFLLRIHTVLHQLSADRGVCEQLSLGLSNASLRKERSSFFLRVRRLGGARERQAIIAFIPPALFFNLGIDDSSHARSMIKLYQLFLISKSRCVEFLTKFLLNKEKKSSRNWNITKFYHFFL